MLKEFVESLIAFGQSSGPGFVSIPGRPDVVVESVRGGFGRIWESVVIRRSEVESFEGLADWVEAVKSHPRGFPQRVVVHASWRGVDALAEWRQIGSVRESWSVSMSVAIGPSLAFVELVERRQGEAWTAEELVTALMRHFKRHEIESVIEAFSRFGVERTVVTRCEPVDGGEETHSVTQTRVVSSQRLPNRIELLVSSSPACPAIGLTFGVEVLPATDSLAIWVVDGDSAQIRQAVSLAVRRRVGDVFESLEVLPEGPETGFCPVRVICGAESLTQQEETPWVIPRWARR